MAERMALRALAHAYRTSQPRLEKLLAKTGDIGTAAQSLAGGKRGHRTTILHVFGQLQKIAQISGKGSQQDKSAGLAQLLSGASGIEAKYILLSSRHPSHWRRRHDFFACLGESLYGQCGEQAKRRSRIQRSFGSRRG